jgi:hypothetical protein
MPGGFPSILDICNATDVGTNAAATLGTAITSSATPNTKGAYTQLIASTPFDTCWVEFSIFCDLNGYSLVNSGVDIAIGGAGSEQVVISNILTGPPYNQNQIVRVAFPLVILQGTRISARSQSSSASFPQNFVQIKLFDGGFSQVEGFSGVDDIGFVSATSYGTLLTPNATANVMGSYAQLTASTARDYAGIFAVFDNGQQNVGNPCDFLIDVAIGAGGSEQIILPFTSHILGTYIGNYNAIPLASNTSFCPISVPVGTRIAARCQSVRAAIGGPGIAVYGVY